MTKVFRNRRLISVLFLAWSASYLYAAAKPQIWTVSWAASQQIPEPHNALPSDDLRDASVFVTVEGDEQEHETALLALRHAAPYVRKQLGFALNLRHTPALHFVRDTVEEKASRVDALLHEIEKK